MIEPTVKQSTRAISRSKLGALERHGRHNDNQPDLQLKGGLQLLVKSKRVIGEGQDCVDKILLPRRLVVGVNDVVVLAAPYAWRADYGRGGGNVGTRRQEIMKHLKSRCSQFMHPVELHTSSSKKNYFCPFYEFDVGEIQE